MTLSRLLTVARGGGAFAAPAGLAEVFEVAASPAAGWPSATQALYANGLSHFGTVDNSGHVTVGKFDHATGAVVLTTLKTLSADQHNAPGLVRRSSDGRLVAMYCDHVGPALYRRISSAPDDSVSWGTETNVDSSVHSANYTYPMLFQLNDEANDPIWCFYRDVDIAGSNWCVTKSTDGGSTWSILTNLTYGTHYYGRMAKASESRLDFTFTDGSLAEEHASVYHMYYEGGTYYQTDGTPIAGSPPFDITDMTLVYDGSTAGARHPNSLYTDGTNIACAFPVQTGTPSGGIGEDGDYIYARWDGADWNLHTMATDVGMITFAFTEGGLNIDPANIDRVALSRRVGGIWRMFLYTTDDDGATWSEEQLTSSGDEDRYPKWIDGHQPELEFVWQKGEFVTEDDWTAALMGYGVPV